jgi:hypothetical protein
MAVESDVAVAVAVSVPVTSNTPLVVLFDDNEDSAVNSVEGVATVVDPLATRSPPLSEF